MDRVNFAEIEALEAAASGMRWEVGEGRTGDAIVIVESSDGGADEMRITRERAPASSADVEFIAHSRDDIRRLISLLRSGQTLTTQEASEMSERFRRASPEPWRVFLESDGGLGGCDVIVVSDADTQPDLYLWRGDKLAPSADFEFVAAARQAIPALVATLAPSLLRAEPESLLRVVEADLDAEQPCSTSEIRLLGLT